MVKSYDKVPFSGFKLSIKRALEGCIAAAKLCQVFSLNLTQKCISYIRTAEAYFCAHEFQHREDEQKQMVDQRSDTLAELRYDDGAEGAEVDGEGAASRLHD